MRRITFWNSAHILQLLAGLWWPFNTRLSIHLSVHVCSGHCSETIHDHSFIFPWKINLTWNMCTVRLFSRFAFRLETMSLTVKIMYRILLRNYKWQMLHIFRACQPDMGHFDLLNFDLDIMTMTSDYCLAQPSIIQFYCECQWTMYSGFF